MIASLSRWIGLFWLPLLIVLHSMPGTGALRSLFLLIGIIHMTVLVRRLKRPLWPMKQEGSSIYNEMLLLMLLSGWLIIQSAFIAPTPAVALVELSTEWFKLSLMITLGILLIVATVTPKNPVSWPVIGLFLGYFAHVLSTLGYQAWHTLHYGTFMLGESFLGNYGYASPFVTGALAFLLAESVIRLRHQRWLPISNTLLWMAIVATLIAQAMLTAKASLVVAVVLFFVAMVATSTLTKQRRWLVLLLVGVLLAIISSLMISNRWQGSSEAITTVIEQQADFQTLTGSSDPLAPVNHLESSTYLRATWAKMGVEGIMQHPLGLGYGADAFGRYVAERGGPKGAISSHSGWIDFTLANGIPGSILLLMLCWAVMRRGWLAFLAGHPAGLASVLVMLNFVVRNVIDGHLTGSRLTGFAVVAAALWMLTLQPMERNEPHPD